MTASGNSDKKKPVFDEDGFLKALGLKAQDAPDTATASDSYKSILDYSPLHALRDKKKPLMVTPIFNDMSGSMTGDVWLPPRERETVIFNKSDISKILDHEVIGHEIPHRLPDMSHLMGPPAGYKGFEPTPEQATGLKDAFDEITREWALVDSRRIGAEVAAQCHDGLAGSTAAMKPLRFRTAQQGAEKQNTFTVLGQIWT